MVKKNYTLATFLNPYNYGLDLKFLLLLIFFFLSLCDIQKFETNNFIKYKFNGRKIRLNILTKLYIEVLVCICTYTAIYV